MASDRALRMAAEIGWMRRTKAAMPSSSTPISLLIALFFCPLILLFNKLDATIGTWGGGGDEFSRQGGVMGGGGDELDDEGEEEE